MEGQSPSRALPKACAVCVKVWRRLYEKERESQGFEQARSADLLSLFLSASRMRLLRNRPAAWKCPRGDRCFASAKRAGFTIAPPQRRILPLVFSAEKTAIPCAQDTKAAVRGAALRRFAKQTEKGAWKRGESLLSHTIPSPFFIKLPCQRKRSTSKPTGSLLLS